MRNTPPSQCRNNLRDRKKEHDDVVKATGAAADDMITGAARAGIVRASAGEPVASSLVSSGADTTCMIDDG